MEKNKNIEMTNENMKEMAARAMAMAANVSPDGSNNSMENAAGLIVGTPLQCNTGDGGLENWFTFSVSEYGTYKIYTTGSLNTIGTLYDAGTGNSVVGQDDNAGEGNNFCITCELDPSTYYYLKITESASAEGAYTLMAEQIFAVQSVNITPQTIYLDTGVTYELPISPGYTSQQSDWVDIPNLSVGMVPVNAACQTVRWSTSTSDIATVTGINGVGVDYYKLTTLKRGIATLYAYAINGEGQYGTCTAYVGCAPVERVELDYTSKDMSIGDEFQLNAFVYPVNALNQNVTWTSSNSTVATVNDVGEVYANSAGTTTITVRTVEGGKTATCVITVDPRPKVIIEEDDEGGYQFFKVTFPASEGSKVWKSVGEDLSELNPTIFDNHYARFAHNNAIEYTYQQLAFLYRLDPLGVAHYAKTHWTGQGIDGVEILQKKDTLYQEIFGSTELSINRFYFTIENNQVIYGPHNTLGRWDKFSNAEVLFGAHTTINWAQFWEPVLTTVFGWVDGVTELSLTKDTVDALFFSGSLWGTASDAAKNYLMSYTMSYSSLLGWVLRIADLIVNAAGGFVDAITPDDISDVALYGKLQEQTYRIVFVNDSFDASMQDIINRCN